MERMIVQLNLEVISENTKTIQTQTVAKPVTGTVRAKPAGAQYVILDLRTQVDQVCLNTDINVEVSIDFKNKIKTKNLI